MIYATRLSLPRGKYNSRVRAALVAAGLAVITVWPAAQSPSEWREAPEYLRTFAPAGERASAYRALVSRDTLDAVLTEFGVAGAPPSGMWAPVSTPPLDAFGQAGRYDRSAVTRLYGSARPRVARGVTVTDGAREVWTLISPHPDATLRRLEPGTLLLVLRYDRANSDR